MIIIAPETFHVIQDFIMMSPENGIFVNFKKSEMKFTLLIIRGCVESVVF